jgi:hypothetical protein
MSDALADVALLRAAGYYSTPTCDPDEDMPHPHAARPGHMPSMDDLVAELEKARGLLKALAATPHLESLFVDDYVWQCVHCHVHAAGDLLSDPANHAPDCPWRKAKEYTQALEAKSE